MNTPFQQFKASLDSTENVRPTWATRYSASISHNRVIRKHVIKEWACESGNSQTQATAVLNKLGD